MIVNRNVIATGHDSNFLLKKKKVKIEREQNIDDDALGITKFFFYFFICCCCCCTF